MGCDIHFRVEYLGPEETVIAQNGDLKIVEDPNSYRWRPAEPMRESEYIARWRTQLAAGEITQELYDSYIEGEPALTIHYNDRFYTGRDYRLFWKLAGVRGPQPGFEPMVDFAENPTIPEDCCEEVAEELDIDDLDLHSHGFYTLAELMAVDWVTFDATEGTHFAPTVEKMMDVAVGQCDGDTTRVRCVFAFDN